VLIVDTGVLLAAADDADPDHDACASLLEQEDGPFVTTGLVVAEAGYLIDRQLGPAAEASFYRSIADGDLRVEALEPADWMRIAALIDEYGDLPLGGTDASLVVLIERHAADRIATLDHRHFSVVRPSTGPVQILPG
jgi:predicted nucleic acid-binding protein